MRWRIRRALWLTTPALDRKSTRLNSSHITISYAVFCLKKKSGGSAEPLSGGARSAAGRGLGQVRRGNSQAGRGTRTGGQEGRAAEIAQESAGYFEIGVR